MGASESSVIDFGGIYKGFKGMILKISTQTYYLILNV